MKYIDTLNEAWAQHLAPKRSDAPTVISTFAGCGGSSLGYSMAGYRELLAVEWDDHAAETFRLNFPDVPVYHDDIGKLSIQECLDRAAIQPGLLDVFDGSPPCQGFSTVGKRILDDPRNHLFREYTRLLNGLQPRAFVMENVSGMVKGKMKLAFSEILSTLKGCGYTVSARLMNTAYFNVPQARQRLIFIGVRNDLQIQPTHPAAIANLISVRRAIEGIASQTIGRPLCASAANVWKHIKPGQNGSAHHPESFFNCIKINPNEPSPTLVKSFGGAGVMMHWTEPRTLSIEELKRCGSFPDQFQFPGKFRHQAARIGNSVPPLFMRAIAKHIRSTVLSEVFLTRLGEQDAIKEQLLNA